jgi:hypothetical protein
MPVAVRIFILFLPFTFEKSKEEEIELSDSLFHRYSTGSLIAVIHGPWTIMLFMVCQKVT